MTAPSSLHVTGELHPNTHGGIGNFVHGLLMGLNDQGATADALTLRPADPRPWSQHYRVAEIHGYVKVLGNPLFLGRDTDYDEAAQGHDVVHGHSHLFYTTMRALAAARRLGKPFVLTNHGLFSQTAPPVMSKAWLRTFGRRIHRRADHVICLKARDRQALGAYGVPADKISVIPTFVDLDAFSPPRRDSDRSGLLFVGRLVPGKGLETLIQAYATIVRRHPGVDLTIVGNGPSATRLHRLVRRLGVSVDFRRHIPHEELLGLYRGAALVVLPSHTEGMPLTVLEAWACGTPVVADDSLRAEVTGAGATCRFGDVEGLAATIEATLERADAGTLPAKAIRRHVEGGFSRDDVVRRHIEVYKAMVR